MAGFLPRHFSIDFADYCFGLAAHFYLVAGRRGVVGVSIGPRFYHHAHHHIQSRPAGIKPECEHSGNPDGASGELWNFDRQRFYGAC